MTSHRSLTNPHSAGALGLLDTPGSVPPPLGARIQNFFRFLLDALDKATAWNPPLESYPSHRYTPLTQVHSTVLSVTGYRTNYRTESMMVMRVVGDLVHLFSSSQKSLGNQICLPVDSLHTDDTDVLAAAFCSGEKQLFGYT